MTHTDLGEKSIIIYIPDHVGLPDMFRENLQSLGLTVWPLVTPNPKNRISVKDTIIHNFRKIFKRDWTYKNKVFAKNRQHDIIQTNIRIKVKNTSSKIIGYQWDGLDRFPAVYDIIRFFDQFFVFDKKDIAVDKRCKPITNFYFDHLFGQEEIPNTDVYFIGSYVESRM